MSSSYPLFHGIALSDQTDPTVWFRDTSLSEGGVRIRHDTYASSNYGLSFDKNTDSDGNPSWNQVMFMDLDNARFGNSATFAGLTGPGIVFIGTDPQIILRESSGDNYRIINDGGTLKVANLTDTRDEITVDGDGDITLGQTTNDALRIDVGSAHILGYLGGNEILRFLDAGTAQQLHLKKQSSTVGHGVLFNFILQDSAAAEETYCQLQSLIETNTAGMEDNQFIIRNIGAGTRRSVYEVSGANDYHIWRGPDSGTELMRLNDTGLGVGGTASNKANFIGSGSTIVGIEGGATNVPELRIGSSADPDKLRIQMDNNTPAANIYTSVAADLQLGTNGTVARMVIDTNGQVGVAATPSGAQLHVDQSSSSGAKPVLKLDQGDIDDSFIDFVGTTAADGSRSISTDTTEDSAKFGAIRIEINGVTKWIRVYDDES